MIKAAAAAEDLDPVIAGPWMLRWQIVHHNAHTALLEKQQQEQAEGIREAGWHKA